MVSIKYNGRLGNNIIQYFAASFFSNKFNLPLITPPNSFNGGWDKIIKKIPESNITHSSGIVVVNDENFLDLIKQERVDTSIHYVFEGYFQTKDFLFTKEELIKNMLSLDHNPQEKKVFVHYRIGDIENTRAFLPLEYYSESLDSLNFSEGYISSDTINHVNCQILMKKYNLIEIPKLGNLDIILYAKDFENIVLSEGTFSWLIGYFSKSENIICNERPFKWYGDINRPEWKKLHWDWVLNDGYRLNKNHKPIKIC